MGCIVAVFETKNFEKENRMTFLKLLGQSLWWGLVKLLQIAATILACIFVIMFCQFVLPWYIEHWQVTLFVFVVIAARMVYLKIKSPNEKI